MHDFLTKIGAMTDSAGNLHFAGATPADAASICPIPARNWLGIAGAEAMKFMQGQFTCDVAKVTVSQSQYGAHCTPKGRMVGSFRLCQRAEQDYLLGLPADNADAVAGNIARYIVFSKAKLTRLDDSYIALGIMGQAGADFIVRYFGTAPGQPGEQTQANGAFCFRIAGDVARFEVWVPAAQALEFWQLATAGLGPGSSGDWELANIRAGIAEVRQATSDELIPQAIGLQHLGGVSFTKGCYTGQEIVARTKYLGKVKRQLYHFTVQNTAAPHVGQKLYKGQSGQVAGLIVAVSALEDAAIEGLAVISTPAIEDGIYLDEAGGCQLGLRLVYAQDAD